MDVANIVPVVEKNVDGTSGALYAIFLNALLASLRALPAGEASLGRTVYVGGSGFEQVPDPGA